MGTVPIRVSIVVPFYNEAEGVGHFQERLQAALARVPDIEFEIVCVDDGSRDDTLARLVAVAGQDPRFVVIELSRNFGKEAALSAGIDAATGDAVIPIDADLQDPPELIPELIAEWRKGADVVLARRSERTSDSWLKRTTAALFYRAHNRVSPIKIPDNVGDFRLMNRAVVDALKAMPERNRFMKGLFAWVGFRTVTVDYARDPRAAGETKFSGWKLWNLALEAFTSFSTAPLKLWTYIGGFGAVASLLYAAGIIARTLIYGADVPGYASLLVVVLFVGSIQLIGIGVLGEYVGRIYLETKQRPGYIVRQRYRRDDVVAGGPYAIATAAAAQWSGGGPDAGSGRAHRASGTPSVVAKVRTFAQSDRVRTWLPILAVVAIVATTFIYNRWMLDPRTFFYADDWQWLWRAVFYPWNGGYEFLPAASTTIVR
jgi:glycosyltransferase involved in cell wall biosynthesis